MNEIIVNGRFLIHKVTGVERYAREILDELDKIIEPDWITLAIPPGIKDIPIYTNIRVKRIGKLRNRLWEQISFPWYVYQRKGIALNFCNVAPLLSPGIVYIHDAKTKAVPQYYSKVFLLWSRILAFNIAKRARAVITVSEFSKTEIEKYLHIDPRRITVIPSAWNHYKRVLYDEEALARFKLKSGRYFFSLSSLEPNKNFKWIAEVAKKNPGYVFVVAGAINKSVFREGLDFDCPANMKLIGYVSDEEAKTLMRECRAFLFPTFYEGFGLPPMEAMGAGAKQIVVSDTAVMHEIYGNCVRYIDPNKYDLNCEFDCYVTDAEKVLNQYTWENNAKKLKEFLKKF